MKFKSLILTTILLIIFNGCSKLPGGDARKNPPQPELRVKKNLEEGKGFRLDGMNLGKGATNFEFASSNELWRASLDSLDFMPLLTANYSGGIIITDWYSSNNNLNESIKISIRFLTNEIRSDALDIKVFTKKCNPNQLNCITLEIDSDISKELNKKILKTATLYKEENKKPKDKKKE